jgi:hypothetical protein
VSSADVEDRRDALLARLDALARLALLLLDATEALSTLSSSSSAAFEERVFLRPDRIAIPGGEMLASGEAASSSSFVEDPFFFVELGMV